MLGTSDVVAFVATTDPARAREFYEGVLGLKFVSDDPFAIVFDLNGTVLRVTKVRSFQPADYTVLGWSVDDLDATVRALAARGVTFERYEGFDQDELGIWRSPDGFRVAWFKDPDGSVLSVS